MNRDELYDKLKEHNIHSRKYFYPLISNFPTYKGLPSSNPSNIPVANEIAEKVLCLPIYPNLVNDEIKIIISVILDCKEKNKEEI
jgi:dTDP-4-amino-4,6-dideoxygalactose transaminase